MPYESWHPAVSENVVAFYALIFFAIVTAAQSRVKYEAFFGEIVVVKKK